jgi:hypothetical protein
VQRNRLARFLEKVEATAILGDIRVADVDDGIEQRHGFRQHSGFILPALGGEFAQASVGGGVEGDVAADEVHEGKVGREREFVEVKGEVDLKWRITLR